MCPQPLDGGGINPRASLKMKKTAKKNKRKAASKQKTQSKKRKVPAGTLPSLPAMWHAGPCARRRYLGAAKRCAKDPREDPR